MKPIELIRLKTDPYDCSYVQGETARMELRLIVQISPADYEDLLSRGWRRFGYEFFRPACEGCAKCRSLRVLVSQFQPSKSQRRTIQKNAEVRVVVQRPTVTEEHLSLFDAFHEDMHLRRGWPDRTIKEEAYHRRFVEGAGEFGHEFLYYEADKLIGVGLVDILPTALSSIYFYHDPALRPRALGVFSVLKELQFAAEYGLNHLYMGYWIAECQSMAYKEQYRPHEILATYPKDEDQPVWIPSH